MYYDIDFINRTYYWKPYFIGCIGNIGCIGSYGNWKAVSSGFQNELSFGIAVTLIANLFQEWQLRFSDFGGVNNALRVTRLDGKVGGPNFLVVLDRFNYVVTHCLHH
jgi:hypothetical protein